MTVLKTSLPAGANKRITIKIKTNDSFKGTKATAINLSADQFNQKSAIAMLTGMRLPL